ncbi:MAG: GIY-YIG nuclease family protein [Prevotella sp.]|nr:GIY-YIG nuclease family protein [Prevotella sp.]
MSINGETRDYKCGEEIDNSNELFLFSVYRNRDSLMRNHFFFYDRQERDEFDGTISLTWETGRRLPKCEEDESYLDDYSGLEMKAEMGKYLVVSLELKNNIPYIVFSVDSKKIRLTNGDSIDMQFVGPDGDKTVLNFPITKNHVERKVSNVYDNSFYCELSREDIYCMMNNDCVSWRARFSKQPLMSVIGSNESVWCPKEYAGDVFKSFATQFMELIEELQNEYTITFSSNSNSKPTVATNETCYVYLMYDTTNGYFKIGISNDPEYRERTLQSEKPTIEKICAKEYPNRIIASAIESALHKAYESKRLRGEWFALDANDVNAIIVTLS